MAKQFTVDTKNQVDLADITAQVRSIVHESDVEEGSVIIFVPHTTCGITINENADPDVKADMIRELNKMVPFEDGYAHGEGNSAAHIKASLMGSSVTIPLVKGEMVLGTWQGIYLFEGDGPRTRRVIVQIQ